MCFYFKLQKFKRKLCKTHTIFHYQFAHWLGEKSIFRKFTFGIYDRLFGWGTKVYVQNQSGPSNSILHCFCLTKGSTLISQDYDPSSVVYVSKPIRAVWRYLLSKFCALLCCSLSQFVGRIYSVLPASDQRLSLVSWD